MARTKQKLKGALGNQFGNVRPVIGDATDATAMQDALTGQDACVEALGNSVRGEAVQLILANKVPSIIVIGGFGMLKDLDTSGKPTGKLQWETAGLPAWFEGASKGYMGHRDHLLSLPNQNFMITAAPMLKDDSNMVAPIAGIADEMGRGDSLMSYNKVAAFMVDNLDLSKSQWNCKVVGLKYAKL
mmetsp:Transcript_8297/g.9765  ORF Transcript_8297/g.9765 Transcript_8297/m.9765 type:complete len:186 (-) Transcript_8297:111-668(-)|eukprot:CAMPEP_0194432968 /NCGR_PEP_ID=MMETSP0176-20130528/74037_1 /TAXON_ID=216777 /ORGANISM="Proboscia alata, Strain PI-D3" /LENGTH=185 /DNA_ID=CAMNT_0039249747 /DNA_START=101 /DNA_END=658 /DNA_ORIENTATION=-